MKHLLEFLPHPSSSQLSHNDDEDDEHDQTSPLSQDDDEDNIDEDEDQGNEYMNHHQLQQQEQHGTTNNNNNNNQNSRILYNKWSKKEDSRLKKAVSLFGEHSWRTISDYVGTRDNTQCRQRWLRTMKPGIQKGKWSEQEDDTLREAVKQNGTAKWTVIASQLPHRTPAQCRERWRFNLSPSLNKSRFTDEEDQRVLELHEKYGNRWSKITVELNTNRSEASVRARYQSLVREQSELHAGVSLASASNGMSTSQKQRTSPSANSVTSGVNPLLNLSNVAGYGNTLPSQYPPHMMYPYANMMAANSMNNSTGHDISAHPLYASLYGSANMTGSSQGNSQNNTATSAAHSNNSTASTSAPSNSSSGSDASHQAGSNFGYYPYYNNSYPSPYRAYFPPSTAMNQMPMPSSNMQMPFYFPYPFPPSMPQSSPSNKMPNNDNNHSQSF